MVFTMRVAHGSGESGAVDLTASQYSARMVAGANAYTFTSPPRSVESRPAVRKYFRSEISCVQPICGDANDFPRRSAARSTLMPLRMTSDAPPDAHPDSTFERAVAVTRLRDDDGCGAAGSEVDRSAEQCFDDGGPGAKYPCF